MGCSDKGETPPPLPLKSNTADYGNLLDNQDLTSPSTPPPPPPHQRVGVLIRAESSFLMMHGTCNETSDRYTHLTFGSASSTIPCSCTSCADVCEFVHVCFLFTFGLVVDLSVIFQSVCHRKVQASVSQQQEPTPTCPPSVIYTHCPWCSDVIDWMITLPLTSIRSPRVVNQRLISPRSATSTLASFTTLLTNLIYPLSRPTDRQ